ncbi:MAG: transposase, partial [Crocinitomicaceae bacterium]|nr:transposase [Crocinitomicaceae bacterium]
FNRLLTGIHHRVSIYYLQNYLDEFAFKYNNRNKKKSFFDLFLQTLIHGSDTYIPEQLFWEDF